MNLNYCYSCNFLEFSESWTWSDKRSNFILPKIKSNIGNNVQTSHAMFENKICIMLFNSTTIKSH